MMTVGARHLNILEGLVEEYIRRAQPIGSNTLVDAMQLAVSPATIRNILHQLEEEGYIFQPHISAGRVPTDKGYRYYVDTTVSDSVVGWEVQEVRGQMHLWDTQQRAGRLVIRALSSATHSLAVGGWLPDGAIEQAGLDEVLDQPEGSNIDAVREVSAALADIDRYVEELSAVARGEATVFIGTENPVFAGRHTSWLVRTVRLPHRVKVVLVVVGPKRMPYRRNMSVLEQFAGMFEEYYS